MSDKRKKKDVPFPERPFVDPYFGEPEDCAALVNKYGTYNLQPTADTENTFPLIAHGLPARWKDMALGKRETEDEK